MIVASLVGCEGLPNLPGPGGGPGGITPNGLVASGRPSWIDGDPYDTVNRGMALAGVGSSSVEGARAEAQETSDNRARGAIALTLQAEVVSEIESGSVFSGWSDGTRSVGHTQLELTDMTRIVGKASLDGAEIRDRYYDESSRTIFSLAVMNRATAASNLAERIERTRQEAQSWLDRAESMRSSGDRARSLGPYLEAFERYLDARLGEATHRVITGSAPNVGTPDRGAVAFDRLGEFLTDLRLVVAQGQSQKGSLGAALGEEIVLRATLLADGRELPVPGVALTLTPEHPDKVRLSAGRVVTDERGEARFRVALANYTGKSGNRIEARLEAVRVGSLDAPKVDVRFVLPTLDTMNVLVVVEDLDLRGQPMAESVVAPKIREALRAAGFPVVSEAAVVRRVGLAKLLSGSRRELAELIGDEVEIIVRGTSRLAPRNAPFAGHVGAEATLALEGIDLRSGQTIVSFENSQFDSHPNSRETAGVRALRTLADKGGAGEAVVNQVKRSIEAAQGR